jgi:hypothetical protein
MAKLKNFLSQLAEDPKKLGEFIHDPEAAMNAAKLSDNDKAALRSGFPAIIYARLAGVPVKEAFQMALQQMQVTPQLPPGYCPPQPYITCPPQPITCPPQPACPPQPITCPPQPACPPQPGICPPQPCTVQPHFCPPQPGIRPGCLPGPDPGPFGPKPGPEPRPFKPKVDRRKRPR